MRLSVVCCRRVRSAVLMPINCRRRATKAPRCCAWASGTGAPVSFAASAKRAIIAASMASVLARIPRPRATSRTWRGLTTRTGRPAACSSAATGASSPPVASIATTCKACLASRFVSAFNPASSRPSVKCSPSGSTCTSSRSFEISIPTMRPARSSMAPVLANTALLHAKRLFGPTMDTGRDPSSPAVLATRGSTVTGPRLPERRRRRSGKSTPIRVSQLPIPSDTRVGVRGDTPTPEISSASARG